VTAPGDHLAPGDDGVTGRGDHLAPGDDGVTPVGATPDRVAVAASGGRHLQLVKSPRLRVADVALFYGERSGGIRTYLDEKAAWAARTDRIEHHLVVPGPEERHAGGRHELRSLRVAASNGYRWPLGAGALQATLARIRPDVVMLHDPFWRPLGVTGAAHTLGAAVVMVHHGSVELDAGAFPGPKPLYRAGFRRWMHRAYAPADAVMSATDSRADTGRHASLPLRFGLHPAFRPRPGAARGDHVLYVGRLAREKGLFELLEAAARSRDPWPLHLVGTGTARDAVAARARRLGVEHRVSHRPYVSDRETLARLYAEARCVLMPGALETFGLVAFEAAAAGASAVACETAPSARLLDGLVHTFPAGDVTALGRAIERAREQAPDHARAAQFAATYTWDRAFAAELADLDALAARREAAG